MRWIMAPDWSDPVAHRLHELLQEAIYHSDDIEQICREIGLDPSGLYWKAPARQLWPAVTHDAADTGLLDLLVRTVRERRPALTAKFDAILNAELPSESWYHCADPFKSKLVGPGNSMAVLDRDGLRRPDRHRQTGLPHPGHPRAGRKRSFVQQACSSACRHARSSPMRARDRGCRGTPAQPRPRWAPALGAGRQAPPAVHRGRRRTDREHREGPGRRDRIRRRVLALLAQGPAVDFPGQPRPAARPA